MDKKNRIGNYAIVLITALAGLADLLTLIPGVGDVLGWLSWIMFAIIFWIKGLGFFSPKKLAISIVSVVTELVPGVQALPTITAGVIAILVMTRAEDKLGISLNPMQKKPGVTMPRNQKTPVNSIAGVRPPRKQL